MENFKLSVIIPVYNEEKTLPKVLKKVYISFPKNKEIIVVDDASNDNTPTILEEFKEKYGLKVVRHSDNGGKGSAVREGLTHVEGDFVIFQDADLEYDPAEYMRLLQPLIDGRSEVVYGSRFLGKKDFNKDKFYFGNKFLSFFTSLIYFRRITDMETCYKAISAEVVKNLDLESNGFDIEPEITAKLFKRGYRIFEIPVSYNPRTIEQGKKIGINDGLKAIKTLFYYRFFK